MNVGLCARINRCRLQQHTVQRIPCISMPMAVTHVRQNAPCKTNTHSISGTAEMISARETDAHRWPGPVNALAFASQTMPNTRAIAGLCRRHRRPNLPCPHPSTSDDATKPSMKERCRSAHSVLKLTFIGAESATVTATGIGGSARGPDRRAGTPTRRPPTR